MLTLSAAQFQLECILCCKSQAAKQRRTPTNQQANMKLQFMDEIGDPRPWAVGLLCKYAPFSLFPPIIREVRLCSRPTSVGMGPTHRTKKKQVGVMT